MPTPAPASEAAAATATAPASAESERTRKRNLTPTQRAAANTTGGKPALRLAIAAKCFECQDTNAGTPTLSKARVRDCLAQNCPLWPHRGWQTSTVRLADSPYRHRTPC